MMASLLKLTDTHTHIYINIPYILFINFKDAYQGCIYLIKNYCEILVKFKR